MVGLMFTTIMTSMGPMLNGVVNYDFWAPEPTFLGIAGIKEFFAQYQPRAQKEGMDPLGYYLPPYAYAAMQVLGQAIETTKGLDQQKVADYIRATEFSTIVGKVKFGKNGEWAQGRTPHGPVPEDPGQRRRAVPRAGQEGRAVSRRVQVREHHLPVFGRQELAGRRAPVLTIPGHCRKFGARPGAVCPERAQRERMT